MKKARTLFRMSEMPLDVSSLSSICKGREIKGNEAPGGYYTYFGYGDVPSGRVSIFTILV